MKSSRFKLEIALREINFITETISSLSETLFENDPLIQRAIVLSLIIIAEESGKINDKIKIKYKNVPWNLMSGMRNKMVHNYDGIDTAIVWKTVKEDIPLLKMEIEKILEVEDNLLKD